MLDGLGDGERRGPGPRQPSRESWQWA
jgi:hypothetical protein